MKPLRTPLSLGYVIASTKLLDVNYLFSKYCEYIRIREDYQLYPNFRGRCFSHISLFDFFTVIAPQLSSSTRDYFTLNLIGHSHQDSLLLDNCNGKIYLFKETELVKEQHYYIVKKPYKDLTKGMKKFLEIIRVNFGIEAYIIPRTFGVGEDAAFEVRILRSRFTFIQEMVFVRSTLEDAYDDLRKLIRKEIFNSSSDLWLHPSKIH